MSGSEKISQHFEHHPMGRVDVHRNEDPDSLDAVRASVGALQQKADSLAQELDTVQSALETERIRNQMLSDHLARYESGGRPTNDAKRDFLGIMSHELRTPLNGILGMAELLAGTPLNEEQIEYVETVRVSGANLLTIIQNVLDYSQLIAEEVMLSPAPVSLEQTVEKVASEPFRLAFEKGLRVALDLAADMPATIEIDDRRFNKILECLLSNAVKFTHEGSIGMGLRVVSRTERNYRLYVEVWDTGIGIAQTDQSQIFDLFYQVDSSDSRAYGGTGLGLALARQLVRTLVGELNVESNAGAGSRFFFELDVAGTPLAREETLPMRETGPILGLSEDPAVRARLQTLGERWSVPAHAYGSAQALVAALRNVSETPVIVIDVPEEESSLAEYLNILSGCGHIALAALTRPGTPIPSLYRGRFIATISHPIWSAAWKDALLFVRALEAERRKRDLATSTSPGTTIKLLNGPRILLVDQQPVNQRIARQMLRRLGCRVDLADSGAGLAGRVSGASYEAILINVNIEEPDGCATAIRLRESLGPETPPLFALGVGKTIGHTARFKQAAFDGAFSAPFTLPQMRQILDQIGVKT